MTRQCFLGSFRRGKWPPLAAERIRVPGRALPGLGWAKPEGLRRGFLPRRAVSERIGQSQNVVRNARADVPALRLTVQSGVNVKGVPTARTFSRCTLATGTVTTF